MFRADKKPTLSITELTGNPITFKSRFANMPLADCKVSIPIMQEGSGTPSPDNIREFISVDSVVLKVSKHTMVIETLSSVYVDANGIVTPTLPQYPYRCVIARVKQGDTYTYSVNGISTFIPVIAFFDKYPVIGTQSYNNSRLIDQKATFIAPINGYVFIRGGGDFNEVNQMVATGTNTDYEQGNTYSISFGKTVYAGTLDVLTGVLTVPRIYSDMGILDWKYKTDDSSAGNPYFYVGIPHIKINSIILSSQYIYNPSGRFNIPNYNIGMWNTISSNAVVVRDDRFTNADDFKTAMDGVQLVYELAEPIEVPLGGYLIEALKGENNLISSVGTITAKIVEEK